jgi:hypothetical protein
VTDPKKWWRKVPGGPFPPEFSHADALKAAVGWYAAEMVRRKHGSGGSGRTPTSWADLCDQYCAEVDARVRGADSTKTDQKKLAKALRRSVILASCPVAAHDDKLALVWLRELLTEVSKRTGAPRDPLTVRNIAAVLGYLYAFAQRIGAYPQDRRLPTEAHEFKSEIAAALDEKKKLGDVGRVACPIATARAVVHCAHISPLRRIMNARTASRARGPASSTRGVCTTTATKAASASSTPASSSRWAAGGSVQAR